MDKLQAQLTQLFSHGLSGQPIQRVLVGYSGGLDSRVLLEAVTMARQHGLSLGESVPKIEALHVHHGLDPAADQWALHCQQVCDQLLVDLEVINVQVSRSGSQEHQARLARYACFESQLGQHDLLLLAHHQDDQIETGLFRLLRGHRFTGMPEFRPIGEGRLYRPLLEVTRTELTQWAVERGLTWVEDSSNASLNFDRNFIRHEILPALKARWSGLAGVLANTLADEADHLALLREIAERNLAELTVAELQPLHGILLEELFRLSVQRRHNFLRHWCISLELPVPGRHVLAEMERQRRVGNAINISWQGVIMAHHQGVLYLHRHPEEQLRPEKPGTFPGGTMSNRIEMGKGISLPPATVQLKVREGGERIADQANMTHKVSQMLQEAGLPPWLRDQLPLIWYEDRVVGIPALPQFGYVGRWEGLLSPSPDQSGTTFSWTFR